RTGSSISIEGSLLVNTRSTLLPRSQDHLHHRAGAGRLPRSLALARPHADRGAPAAVALPGPGAAVEGRHDLPRGGLLTSKPAPKPPGRWSCGSRSTRTMAGFRS